MRRCHVNLWMLLAVVLSSATAQAQPAAQDYTVPELVFEDAEPIEITSVYPPDEYGRFQVYFVTDQRFDGRVFDPGCPREGTRLPELLREQVLADLVVGPQLSELQRQYMQDGHKWLSYAQSVPIDRFPNFSRRIGESRGRNRRGAPDDQTSPWSFVAASPAEARLIATKVLELANAGAYKRMAATADELAAIQRAAAEMDAPIEQARQRVAQAQAALDAAKAQVTDPDHAVAREELLVVARDLRRLAVDLAGSEARAAAITRLRKETSSTPVQQRLEIMLVEHDVELADLLGRQATLINQRDRLRGFVEAWDNVKTAQDAMQKLTSEQAGKRHHAEELQRRLQDLPWNARPVRLTDAKVVLRPIVVSKGSPQGGTE